MFTKSTFGKRVFLIEIAPGFNQESFFTELEEKMKIDLKYKVYNYIKAYQRAGVKADCTIKNIDRYAPLIRLEKTKSGDGIKCTVLLTYYRVLIPSLGFLTFFVLDIHWMYVVLLFVGVLLFLYVFSMLLLSEDEVLVKRFLYQFKTVDSFSKK